MPRGGRRAGAGRKPKFDEWDRIALGAACEKRATAAQNEALKHVWAAKPGVAELRTLHEEFRRIPLDERRQFYASHEGQELASEVEQQIRATQRTPDFVVETKRTFEVAAPRAKNLRQTIIKDVAAEFSNRWGVEVTAGAVDKCWKEYRALARALSDDPEV